MTSGRSRFPVILLVVTMLAAVAMGLAAAPVGGQTSPPGDTDPPVTLTLVSQSPWVAPQGTFALELRIDNPPADARLALQVHDDVAGAGRERLDETVRGDDLGRSIGGPPPLPIDALERTPAGAVQFSVPVASSGPVPPFGVRLGSDGIYPVSLTVIDGDGAERATLVTHLIRLPSTADTPLAVALVVPVHAPPSFQPDGVPRIDAGELGRLTSAIDAVTAWPRVPLTVQATPETVDALNASSAEGTARVRALAGALGGRQLVGGAYVDYDVAAFVASANPLAGDEIDRQAATGQFVLSQLLRRPDTAAVIAGPTTSPAVLEKARAGGAERVVVPEDRLGPLSRSSANARVQRFDVVAEGLSPMTAVSADGSLAARLTQTGDPVLNAHLLLADLAMIYHEAPNIPHGVTVLVPRDAAIPLATYGAVLEAFDQRTPAADAAAVVSPVTVDGLFSVTDAAPGSGRGSVATREYRSNPPASADELLDVVAGSRSTIGSFASMATSPQGGIHVALLDRQVLVAEATGLPDERRQDYFGAIDSFIGSQVGRIHAQGAQNVTLTSRSERIRIGIENQLDYAVEVEVFLESTKLEFPEGDTQLVTLTPNGVTTVEAAVESRASGVFPLDITVRTPDDRVHLATTRVTVRSTAISGIGLVLSIGAGLFLLLWWARHFRSARRARRLVSSSHPAVVSNRTTDPLDDERARPASHASATLPRATGEPSTDDGSARDHEASEGKHAERPHRH